MGKTNNQSNKKHRHKKDKRKHKERSKEEHLKKKQLKKLKQEKEKFEATRYTLDDHEYHKLLRLIQDLISHNPNTKHELPEVFRMVDNGNEVDIIDIEDVFVRDKLERMFEMLGKQIEKKEDEDGRYLYVRSGTKSLETQMREYIERATEDIQRPEWMRSMSDTLSQTLGPLPKENEKSEESDEEQERLARYMEDYNQQNRPVSLMEMHMNKKGPSAKGGSEQYLYGHKTIDKRFSGGKFYSSFS